MVCGDSMWPAAEMMMVLGCASPIVGNAGLRSEVSLFGALARRYCGILPLFRQLRLWLLGTRPQASPRGRAKARGPKIQTEVAFELFHLGEPVGVEEQLIVEIKTGTALDPSAIAQLLNYLNVTKLPLGLVLFFGPKPKVKRIIRDDTREYPVIER